MSHFPSATAKYSSAGNIKTTVITVTAVILLSVCLLRLWGREMKQLFLCFALLFSVQATANQSAMDEIMAFDSAMNSGDKARICSALTSELASTKATLSEKENRVDLLLSMGFFKIIMNFGAVWDALADMGEYQNAKRILDEQIKDNQCGV